MHTKLKYNFELMELDDHFIAVPVDEYAKQFHGVIKLNKTGAFIFGLLKEDITEEDIVSALSSQYNGSKEKMVEDVHRYVESFREKGLLV